VVLASAVAPLLARPPRKPAEMSATAAAGTASARGCGLGNLDMGSIVILSRLDLPAASVSRLRDR
jgi:hypothetical protein